MDPFRDPKYSAREVALILVLLFGALSAGALLLPPRYAKAALPPATILALMGWHQRKIRRLREASSRAGIPRVPPE